MNWDFKSTLWNMRNWNHKMPLLMQKYWKILRNYLKRILVLLQKMRHKFVLLFWSKCLLTQVSTNLLQKTLTHFHLNIMTGWRKKLTKCWKLVWSGKVNQAGQPQWSLSLSLIMKRGYVQTLQKIAHLVLCSSNFGNMLQPGPDQQEF